jgi:hypothetical protein
MADFHYGGTDEESAEIKKLNAEVVSRVSFVFQLIVFTVLIIFAHSSRIPTISRIGRSLFALQKPWKAA